MIAKDKILVFDRLVVLVAAAPVKISLALIGQIAHETVLKIGGRLFSDTLSERGGPSTSYFVTFDPGGIMTALQAGGSLHQKDYSKMPKGRA